MSSNTNHDSSLTVSKEERDLLANVARSRQTDGLAMFRALVPGEAGVPENAPNQAELISEQATETLYRGGNRAGKSIVGAVRMASVMRDRPFIDVLGRQHHVRATYQRGRPLIIWIIGLQLNHIGQTIHRLLFRPGLYKVIEDQETGLLRPFREWDEADRNRKEESKESPPLVPMSEVEDIAWSKKASHEFDAVFMKNGTEVYAFASTADVKQGDPVDWIWIDERIAFPGHYGEWRARLIDKRGKMYWTSRPWAGNTAMMDLTRKAERQQEEVEDGVRSPDDVHVVEHRLRTSNNPTLDKQSMKEFSESLSEEELAIRDDGEYEIGAALIYPHFNKVACSAIVREAELEDRISKILRRSNGIPPADWTHEIILDPGTYKPGVLFGAVPPPELWRDSGERPVAVIYDEIYAIGMKFSAKVLAKHVKQMTPSDRRYRRFIIDDRAGRQTPMGFEGTVAQNYWKEMQAAQVPGSDEGFWVAGSDNFKSRKMIVDQYLTSRSDGLPSLRIVIERCPLLCRQMAENHYMIDQNGFVNDEKPAPKQKDDLREGVEYWLSRSPSYMKPLSSAITGGAWERYKKAVTDLFGPQPENKPEEDTVNIGGAG